jgi:transposase
VEIHPLGVRIEKTGWMGPRFRRVDRDQQFLLPPDVREWLPAGHPALFVAELVEQLDLSVFVAGYRSSVDRGRPAYHPAVMVGIALYSTMTATMSSRRIERLLATDVGFRVVAANQRPDHNTICRFLVRHKEALAGLFAQVVGLAAEAGLIDPTLVALDGTKLAGDASPRRNVTLGELRDRFCRWAEEVEVNDAAADQDEAEHGGSGPIEEMFEQDTMRDWIRRRLDDRGDDDPDSRMNLTDPDSRLMKRSGGGWVQGYNAQAAAVSGGIVVAADVTSSVADSELLEPMTRRIGDAISAATGERAGVIVADAGYWNSDTIEGIDADDDLPDVLVAPGQKLPETAPAPLAEPDPDYAKTVAAYRKRLVTEHARRVAVISAVINGEMTLAEAGRQLGITATRVKQLTAQWQAAGADPDSVRPRRLPGEPRRPARPSRAARCRHDVETRLARPAGRSLYRQRKAIIEPVFGDIKTNRRIGRFLRRGIDNIKAEWYWILTGHNLTILHQRGTR